MMLEVNKPLIKSLPKLYIKESAAIMRLNMSLKASTVCYLAALFRSFYNPVWTLYQAGFWTHPCCLPNSTKIGEHFSDSVLYNHCFRVTVEEQAPGLYLSIWNRNFIYNLGNQLWTFTKCMYDLREMAVNVKIKDRQVGRQTGSESQLPSRFGQL